MDNDINEENKECKAESFKPDSPEYQKRKQQVQDEAIKVIQESDSFVLVSIKEGFDTSIGQVVSMVGASMSNHTGRMILNGFRSWLEKFKSMYSQGMKEIEENTEKGGDGNERG